MAAGLRVAELSAYTILLRASIVLGPRNQDGRQVCSLADPWLEIVRLISRDTSALFTIPWDKMEELIAGAYVKAGYSVTLTPRSGDLGRDVIAEKPEVGRIRLLESVKAYKAGHLVQHDDVRALIGVMSLDDATHGVVTTTSDFAPGITNDRLIKKALAKNLELRNGAQLIPFLESIAKGEHNE